jgi:hypothetical protein
MMASRQSPTPLMLRRRRSDMSYITLPSEQNMIRLRTYRELPVGSPERECVAMAMTTLDLSIIPGIDIDRTVIDNAAGRITFRDPAGTVLAVGRFDLDYYGGLRAYVIPSLGLVS